LNLPESIPPVIHAPGCEGCGGVYQCTRCGNICGWCYGAWDNMPALCDDCFVFVLRAPTAME